MGVAQPALGDGTRRTTRALYARVSSGHVVMVLAGALGVLLTLSVLQSADHTIPVLVAAKDLAPGTVVDEGDVRVARVRVDAGVRAGLFGIADLGLVRGQVVTGSIRRGALVPRESVRAVNAGAATRVMSFPIARARAVDGTLVAGDRVDVVAVDHDTARAGYVLNDAEVTAVQSHGTGPLSGAAEDVTISLAVDPDAATRLVAALDAGTVTLVRATGAAPVPAPAPFVPGAKG
jgi:pilus assembly protein CpaB